MYDFQNEIKQTTPCLSSFSPHTEHKDVQRPLQLLFAQQEARSLQAHPANLTAWQSAMGTNCCGY